MLGRFRKKVTKQVIEMIRQPYAVFQSDYGVPARFWQDEFVLGFFGIIIGVLLKSIGEDRLSQADKGRLLVDVFSGLSNMNGTAIARQFSELAHENPQSEDFVRGADNGEIVALIIFGKVSETGRDIVERAKMQAEEQGMSRDIPAIQMILWRELFFDPVIDRFAISKRGENYVDVHLR